MSVAFQSPLEELIEFASLKEELSKKKGPVLVSGCIDSQRVHLACQLGKDYKLLILVTYQETRARKMEEDARCFGDEVFWYPAKDILFDQAAVQGNLLLRQRMAVLKQLLEEGKGIVVTTIDALMDEIFSPQELEKQILEIVPGQELALSFVTEKLAAMGYERLPQVENAGQFSLRGGILDFFPITEEIPVRVEMWGAEVDSVRSFDPQTQRSVENLDWVRIYPAKDRDGQSKPKTGGSLLDYLPREACLALDEPLRMEEKADAIMQELQESMVHRREGGYTDGQEMPSLISPREIFSQFQSLTTVAMTGIEHKCGLIKPIYRGMISAQSVSSYSGNFEILLQDLRQWKKEKARVVLLAGSRTRARRLADDLQDYDVGAVYAEETSKMVMPGQVLIVAGSLHKGFAYPSIHFYVLSEGDLFGKEKKKKRRKSPYEGKNISTFSELSVGDYVIHENHGLGIYQGSERMEIGGVARDYMKITYGDGGNLYIPVTQMNLVQKYAGADAEKVPRLNRLGGNEWNRTKTRVKGAVKEIAQELVKLYAARQNGQGFACGPDTVWQKEFEEQFPYEETDDQLAAIEATKADMESPRIMDRLICGDVGYGKTEIAIRAAFKAVQEGKQVAYLVPTTILAQQHYHTFMQRMKDYPVEVDLLCRFCTPIEQKRTVERISRGRVDIVIGTHRMLSGDVRFKDLGLLIVDEEQRFGVSDKEKIKQLKENVDVLALSATPIPRTLHMSLVGIRDMSVLEQAPMDRLPIQTYVMEYHEELVREAIHRELSRGGQIYYVYNQVKGIADITARIGNLVPDANVVFAHGQMKSTELERIMLDFIHGEIDVLVSTTIIETGLDISNVNTILIHDADRFGLSQLYQLRGRVGRSNRTAYAFLFYRRDKMLKEVAEKRLSAIREYTELGSGIRIAMRDLEIRGAGNILGAQQHGHMEAVGYDLYCKMLGMAVQELKGEKKETADFETTIDLEVDAYLPDGYIQNEGQKMSIYKRIAAMETEEDYGEMQDELIDRFGDLPRPVQNLLRVARMKAVAHQAYVTELSGNRDALRFLMYPMAPVRPEKIAAFVSSYRGDLRVMAGDSPCFTYVDQRKRNINTERFFDTIGEILEGILSLMENE